MLLPIEADVRLTRLATSTQMAMDIRSELRFAARVLLRRPGLSIGIALSISLSIWMATSVFSVAYGILLRPLPYPDADRVVVIHNAPAAMNARAAGAGSGFPGWGIARPVRESAVLAERAMFIPGGSGNLTGADRPERVRVVPVSDRFFATLGTAPLLGRVISSGDDVAAAVLSYAAWRRFFTGDRTAVGRTIRINEHPYTLLGVMPAAFSYPGNTDVWISLPEIPDLYVNAFGPLYLGRLRGELTRENAEGALRTQTDAYYRERGVDTGPPIDLVTLHDEISGNARNSLRLLVGAALLVLLLGAVNTAMLLVAHVGRRRAEFSVRKALGAAGVVLYRQLVLECLILALTGAAAGVVLAVWSDDALRLVLPADTPRMGELGIGSASMLFAAVCGTVIGVVTGVVAGLRALRIDANPMRGAEARASGTVEGRRLLRSLVLAEIAVAFVLATGTGLLTRSLRSASQVNLGFEPDRLTTFRLQMPESAYPTDRRLALVETVVRDLRAIPGVTSVGVTNDLPLAGQMGASMLIQPLNPSAGDSARGSMRVASDDYFRALGIPLREGRTFTDADRMSAPKVLLVSERLARSLAPKGSVIGIHVRLFRLEAEIVGVVGDVRHFGPDQGETSDLYQPYAQFPISNVSFAVRSTANVAAAIRARVHVLAPSLPVFELRPMTDIVSAALSERRFALTLVGLFAAFGIGLAAFGVYSVTSVMVVERTREIGIRVALGATRTGVLRLVLREGVATGLAGAVIGTLGALWLTPALVHLLFGVRPNDAATLVAVAALMVVVTLGGVAVPAWRASRVEPIVALRRE
jgi:putative ABC transport system permease protein